MAFHPYLYFNGNCREAFTRYQEIFGGELTIMTGHDTPPDAGIPENKMDVVIHAALMNDGELLMASDSFEDDFAGPNDGIFVHYSTTDLGRAKSIFADLSDGGTVYMDGHEEFWTPFFGIVKDAFGIPWQISVEAEANAG
ncbi:MAG: VOC family protein [Actinomycetota bacterium]